MPQWAACLPTVCQSAAWGGAPDAAWVRPDSGRGTGCPGARWPGARAGRLRGPGAWIRVRRVAHRAATLTRKPALAAAWRLFAMRACSLHETRTSTTRTGPRGEVRSGQVYYSAEV